MGHPRIPITEQEGLRVEVHLEQDLEEIQSLGSYMIGRRLPGCDKQKKKFT
jgi:hypothetical protein